MTHARTRTGLALLVFLAVFAFAAVIAPLVDNLPLKLCWTTAGLAWCAS